MRKSNKCEYTIGVNTRKKRKFLRPEEAMDEATRLNSLPHVIKKCVAYKCTTCHFFHVGRTTEDIPRGPLMIPQPEPEEIMGAIEPVVENYKAMELNDVEEDFDWRVKNVPLKDEPTHKENEAPKKPEKTDHDDFDWDSDPRLLFT